MIFLKVTSVNVSCKKLSYLKSTHLQKNSPKQTRECVESFLYVIFKTVEKALIFST